MPRLNAAKSGTSAAVPANAKAARAGSATSSQPQWKRSHAAMSSCAARSAPSQTGVSWSHSVNAIAAAPRAKGEGGDSAALIALHAAGPRHRVEHGAEG